MSKSRNLRCSISDLVGTGALPDRSAITPITNGISTFSSAFAGIFVGDVNARRTVPANEFLTTLLSHLSPPELSLVEKAAY